MRKKKVGILTLVLHSNFGYLMQAYALQQVIKKIGCDPYTYQIWEETPSTWGKFVVYIKNIVAKYLLRRSNITLFQRYVTSKERLIIDKHTRAFIKKHLQLSTYLKNIRQIKKLKDEYEACIVGSDQVWRRWYAPHIQTYFFNFLPNNVKRTSYAASFGLSHILYNDRQKKECGMALRKFSSISVRENDGVGICKKEWGLDAVCVLDPTLLLKKEEYIKLIDVRDVFHIPAKPYLLCYILDESKEKNDFVNRMAANKGLVVFNIKPQRYTGLNDINKCVYPSISVWIEGFNKASYVITDSFHGTVFSIIFEKQFITIGNEKRGISRFTTLLGELNLINRLTMDLSDCVFDKCTIDYSNVNLLLSQRVKDSYDYLVKFLEDEE